MRLLLHWLFAVPIGFVLALVAGLVFLVVAGASMPEVTAALAGGAVRALTSLFGEVASPEELRLAVEAFSGVLGLLTILLAAPLLPFYVVLLVLVGPLVLVAGLSEIFGVRSLLAQVGFAGLFAMIFPLAALGLARAPSADEMRIMLLTGAAGAVAGFVYWAIAGRRAGFPARAAPVSASASSGS